MPGNNRVRAPAWGAELPPLPARRVSAAATVPGVEVKSEIRSRFKNSKSHESLPKVHLHLQTTPPVPPVPPLRRDSSQDVGDTPPRLAPRLPPRVPSRDRLKRSQTSPGGGTVVETVEVSLPIRKLPPAPISGAAADKLRQSGFGGLKSTIPEIPKLSFANGGPPPPVPVSSRPDLSKIQATKPRVSTTVSTGSGCLKCRDFSAPDAHAARFPRASLPSQDLAWLARELTAPFPSATDRARAIFTWLHYNISYDVQSFFSGNLQPATPERTMSTGLAVCEGYALLFATLASHAGLEAIKVSGHGKGFGHHDQAPGDPLPPYTGNHAWNAVRLDDGRWKLIDSCWGAGHIDGPGRPYVREFNPVKFSETNDEFGLRHFPANKEHFFRDDGRPSITWEEYMRGDGLEQPRTFDIHKRFIGERTFHPAAKTLSISQPGPIRFQFALLCEHWSLERHAKEKPGLFLLIIHGLDGRHDERLPLTHVRGSTPGGGGDFWYFDLQDPRTLGAPGQKASIAVLTKFGDRDDCRGLTAEEYLAGFGPGNGGSLAWSYIAEWELV
ncbi:hypothetical protein ASPZODRAFT_134342 [Penicilliopsis zonata CBS 506.65]|uniref:Transglutaminase-like domain-containing protein n=1 Tax=Penicilliopsis zonata CBS 506.65 TaxID=1073090 RepID=A0A1L9SCU7_9EURO|nr:hypothetical protein ASPZODRAFT_134342 [Penicilliopsis zonata CBS 506.65]OJJ44917.1 hypothetical protein ASPZODRAFT_134342 [Penicilliopsis zonata CBS 506.65]